MKRTAGFTLIELMVVVAIIAILAAIAAHAYMQAIAKTQLSEAFTVADGLKTQITGYQTQVGTCPDNSVSGFLPAASYAGKYVRDATLGSSGNSCTILVAFKTAGSVTPQLAGSSVTFTAAAGVTSGAVQWECASSLPLALLPQTCR